MGREGPGMRQRTLFLFLAALCAALLLGGCSGSETTADGPPLQPVPDQQTDTNSTILVRHTLLRAIPAEVTDLRFTGRDAGNSIVFGPTTRSKAAEILLSPVPLSLVRLDIEYLNGPTVVGVGSNPVTLVAGQTYTLDDPPFTDLVELRSLSVTPANPSVAAGTNQQFSAVGTFSDGTTQDLTSAVQWSSSDSGVALIAPGGLASGASAGTTTITAQLNGVSGSTQLTVTALSVVNLTSLAVTPVNPTVTAGFTQQFQATGTFSDGTTQNLTSSVAWSSSNMAAAGINGAGLATSAAAGSTTITATLNSISGGTNLTVTPATLVSIAVTPTGNLSACGMQQFTAMGTFSDGNVTDITATCTWTSSNTASLTIVANSGLATTLVAGLATVTATSGAVMGTADMTVQALSGTFNAPINLSAGTTPRDIALGDLNGDNIPDLVNTDFNAADPGPDVDVWLGVGDGTFTGPTTIDLAGTGFQGVALVDFNNDLVLDLVVTQQFSDNVLYLPGNGDGTFNTAAVTTVNTGANTAPNRIVVGRFDAGNTPDLAITLTNSSQVAIFLGNGSGFAAPTMFATGSNPWGLTLGDLNRDNIQDIVVASIGTGTAVYHQGVGDGTFAAGVNVAPANTVPACDGVCVADFDGDLDPDVGMAGQGSDGRVFTGNGDGTFTSGATISGINGQSAFWVTAGDINCDGFNDLVFGLINGTAGIRTVLGNGDGTFQTPVAVATGSNASVVLIGSVNTTVDQKPDIVVDNQGGTLSVLIQQ